jgi:hypothetical protein
MSRHKRHDREKRRTFSGEEDAELVLDWLNNVKRDTTFNTDGELVATRTQILEILDVMQDHVAWIKELPEWPPTETDDVPFGSWEPFADLNEMLVSYTFCPVFVPDARERRWRVEKAASSRRNPDEVFAVHALVDLAKQGRIDRLKECACGRWYYARFSHQRFCSAECRVKFWEDSEERKEQKRDRARKYYEYHKVHKRK